MWKSCEPGKGVLRAGKVLAAASNLIFLLGRREEGESTAMLDCIFHLHLELSNKTAPRDSCLMLGALLAEEMWDINFCWVGLYCPRPLLRSCSHICGVTLCTRRLSWDWDGVCL